MSYLAEKNVIGYLLLDSSRISASENKITRSMFTTPIMGDIYAEFEEGYSESREVNAVTLQTMLLEKGYAENIVSKTLMDCVSDVDFQSSFGSCIESISNDYKVRLYGEKVKGKLPPSADIDDAIKKTILELENMLDGRNEDIKSVADIAKANKDLYFKPGIEKTKVFFGLREIDRLVGGVEGGDVVILAARPAVGKSAMALQIIDYNAKKGKKVGYFNLEMQEKQVYERMIAKASGIELNRIRNATRFLQDEEQRFNSGNEKLASMENIFVRSGSARVSDLRTAVKNGNFDLVVIDYLQLLKPDKGRGSNRYAEVGDISRGVKAIAMDCDVPIIALSQLNRASEGKEDREPTMAELRESGDIEQDASVIIMLWNSDKDDRTKKKIKVDKARQGKLGTEELVFNGATMTFTSYEKPKDEPNAEFDDNPFV